MTNQTIAKLLREIGLYLEMDDVPFKPQAYERAASSIEILSEDVSSIYKKDGGKGLLKIPGVGRGIAEKIIEYLENGAIDEYEKLKKKIPVDITGLSAIEGLGPKNIKRLYKELGVRSVKDLEKAARSHKIKELEGFGEKSEEKILRGILFLRKSGGRSILGYAMPFINTIEKRLGSLKYVKKIVVAGSVRRRKETIGDIDILIISDNADPVMEFFVKMPEVIEIFGKGSTKSSVKVSMGLNIDLRVLPQKSYGAGLNYFTGSKEHNVTLRELAIKKGYKLSEYGLFKGKKQLEAETEEKIYELLGLDYIEPELRENTGETEAALRQAQGKTPGLPDIIGYDDLEGDLQIQTNWTDGKDSIETMAKTAMAMGLKYILITDHTKRLAMTGGLDEKKIVQQWKEIDRINKKLHASGSMFCVLKGSECDILKDGSLDLPDNILSKLDICGASVHSFFSMPQKDQTLRIKRAMQNPNVDILFHPTGRLIGKREAYALDIDEIIGEAKKTNTILEIDAFPDRTDLNDENIRKCVNAGVKMAIDSDAHAKEHIVYLEYGVAQARRGWATAKDIVNAWPLEKMRGFLKKS